MCVCVCVRRLCKYNDITRAIYQKIKGIKILHLISMLYVLAWKKCGFQRIRLITPSILSINCS